MRNSRGETIGIREAEEMAEWLVYHMTMEQRRKLMAERPVLYAHWFPEASAIAITDRVRDAIADTKAGIRHG